MPAASPTVKTARTSDSRIAMHYQGMIYTYLLFFVSTSGPAIRVFFSGSELVNPVLFEREDSRPIRFFFVRDMCNMGIILDEVKKDHRTH